jgi:hypothetical protein
MKMHITSALRKSSCIGFALLCASGIFAHAGDLTPDSKETKEVTPPAPENPWQFQLAAPSWLAATSGTVGVDGVNSHVYLSADELLKHLDMTAALSTELRYQRFGFYGDFLYVNLSDTMSTNGLVNKASVGLAQWVANMELNYRAIEGGWGWIDVRAGARYTNLYNTLSIYPNDGAINQASQQLVTTAFSTLGSALEKDLRNLLDSKIATPPVPDLDAGQKLKLLKVIIQLKRDPGLAAAIQAQAQATTAALKAAAQARVNAAMQRVANDIAGALKANLNRSASLGEDWWDPYVGVGGHYNFYKNFYLAGKTDIGGFSAGSQLTWQAYAGLGCNLTPNIYAELGYRYLYTNYKSGGFLYDVTQSGAQLTVGIKF